MKNKDTNVKSDNLSNGGKSGVCKDFKDIWKLMDLVQELQNSEQTLPTSGQKVTEEKKDYGNKRN
jgi:hypothetical protein